MLVSGSFYEVLHFRHVWALFGLIAAMHIALRASAEGTAGPAIARDPAEQRR